MTTQEELDKLRNLKLHETFEIENSTAKVIRVPGGLIYYFRSGSYDGSSMTSQFISFTDFND